jgi:hypothetical protein
VSSMRASAIDAEHIVGDTGLGDAHEARTRSCATDGQSTDHTATKTTLSLSVIVTRSPRAKEKIVALQVAPFGLPE